MNLLRTHRSADHQASLWAAKLDGGVLSRDEQRDLNTWLEASPAHRTLLSTYCQLSTDLEQQLPLLEGNKDGEVVDASASTIAQSHPWSLRPLWVGAMLTAAAAVALVFWMVRPTPAETHRFSTAGAERQTVALADGSQIELNAHTQIETTQTPTERRVRLARGQAFFSVQRDAHRPFLVDTPRGQVRVTGTRFDVRADTGSEFQITVLEGSVLVQSTDEPSGVTHVLQAGDQYLTGTVQPLSATELDAILAWRSGEIVFRGAPLKEVLAAFSRHHERNLAASALAAELRLGGRFNLDNLDEFLLLLPQVTPVTVKRDAGGNVQVVHRTES